MMQAAPGLLAAVLWIAILWWSDRHRSARIWPPLVPGRWTAAWAWGLTILIYVGVIRAGGGDDFLAPVWLRWGVGGGLSVAGSVLHGWGTVGLGLKGTSGWPVPLKTDGAFGHRRHPQYLGQSCMLLGLAVLLGGGWALLAALAGIAALIYAALVEDRHLAQTAPGHAAYRARTRLLV